MIPTKANTQPRVCPFLKELEEFKNPSTAPMKSSNDLGHGHEQSVEPRIDGPLECYWHRHVRLPELMWMSTITCIFTTQRDIEIALKFKISNMSFLGSVLLIGYICRLMLGLSPTSREQNILSSVLNIIWYLQLHVFIPRLLTHVCVELA